MLFHELRSILIYKLSPKKYKFDSEMYGLQYNTKSTNKLIKKVMLTIDLSIEALHYALKNKISLIISNHGLVNNPIEVFNQNLINKLILLNKYPISIFVLNSSFTAAEGGVSDTLADSLYLNIDNTFEIKNCKGIKVPIGRICTPKNFLNNCQKITLEDLIKRIKINLNLTQIIYVGNLKKQIKKICLIGGDYSNVKYLKKAVKLGCDCFISGKINYFDAIFGRDTGLNLIETSHYEVEVLALKKLSNILSLEFPYTEFTVFDSGNPFHVLL